MAQRLNTLEDHAVFGTVNGLQANSVGNALTRQHAFTIVFGLLVFLNLFDVFEIGSAIFREPQT